MRFNKFNQRGGFGLLQLIMAVALIAILAAFALPARAIELTQATVIRPAITNNTVLTLTNGTVTLGSPTNVVIDVQQGKRLGLFLKGASSTGSTSNVLAYVEGTPDGTNWITTPIATNTLTLNGTAAVTSYITIEPSVTDGLRKVRLRSFYSTAIANYYMTNAWLIYPK